MKLTLVTVLMTLLTTNLYASSNEKCVMTDSSMTKVKWTAFKMPLKVGVSGTFKKTSINGVTKGKSIMDVMNGKARFSIDASSVFSKHPARDKKLAKFVFSTLTGGSKITGNLVSMTKKVLTIAVKMNGKTVNLPMKYTIDGMKLVAKGTIDMFDFAMHDEVKAINKACLAKHEGKTWSDVDLTLTANFKSCR